MVSQFRSERGNAFAHRCSLRRAKWRSAALGAIIGALQGGAAGAAIGAGAGAATGLIVGLTLTTNGSNIEFLPGSVFIMQVSGATSRTGGTARKKKAEYRRVVTMSSSSIEVTRGYWLTYGRAAVSCLPIAGTLSCRHSSRPERVVERFLQAFNDKDLNILLTCVDPRQEQTYRASFRILEWLSGGRFIKEERPEGRLPRWRETGCHCGKTLIETVLSFRNFPKVGESLAYKNRIR